MEEIVIKHCLFKTLIFTFLSVTYCISVMANDNTVLIPVEVEDTIVNVPIPHGVDHTNKKLVIRKEKFSDNFPLLRIKGDWRALTGGCESAEKSVCLPQNCKFDYKSTNGRGYNYESTGGKGEILKGGLVHGYLEKETHVIKGKCLTSFVKVCRQAWFRSGAKYKAHHVIYGKCAYFE